VEIDVEQRGVKMRIMVLIMGIMLVASGVAAANDTPRQDCPRPPGTLALQDGFPYTGIIKNNTGCEVSIPSENSDATLVIPAHSWIEYTMWTRSTEVTAYHNGKPFYCLKLFANPCQYPFICKKYDFMAEIVKPEAVPHKYKPMKKRKRLKKQPKC
jgi:hypothetical protein